MINTGIKLGKRGEKGVRKNNGKITELIPLLFRNRNGLNYWLNRAPIIRSQQADYGVDGADGGFFVENLVTESLAAGNDGSVAASEQNHHLRRADSALDEQGGVEVKGRESGKCQEPEPGKELR